MARRRADRTWYLAVVGLVLLVLVIGLMFAAAVLLWNTFLLYPVKLFVVALHELSHGLMAVLVGTSPTSSAMPLSTSL